MGLAGDFAGYSFTVGTARAVAEQGLPALTKTRDGGRVRHICDISGEVMLGSKDAVQGGGRGGSTN